jgi:dTDP-4-amino-4,6-dideoxygalactose transaminase
MAVSIFCQHANYNLIDNIESKYKILLIKDNSQSFSAIYKNKKFYNFIIEVNKLLLLWQ